MFSYRNVLVIDSNKPFSDCFKPIDHLCHTITQRMVNTMIIIYTILSIVQGILNGIYCYLRDDSIDPHCLYAPFKFRWVGMMKWKTASMISFEFISSSPWDQNTLIGRCGTIIFCAIQATIFTYVTTTFLSFFISISLQFDALRLYMKYLIDELDYIIDVRGNKEKSLQSIICLHIAIRE